MDVLRSKVKIDDSFINLLNFNKNKICFFDIETTGFNRNKDYIYIIGFLYYDKSKSSWIIKQLFIDNIYSEKKLLLSSISFLNSFDYIINYNGTTFDIPFINKRSEYNGINSKVKQFKSFDIYQFIRKNKCLYQLNNLKLETIEEYLGIYRKDKLSGKDSIQLFHKYRVEKDPDLKKLLLLHNFEDLVYLPRILKILDKININIPNLNTTFLIENIIYKNDFTTISGIYLNTNNKNFNIDVFEEFFSLNIKKNNFRLILQSSLGYITPEITGLVHLDSLNFTNFNEFNNYNLNLLSNFIIIKVEDHWNYPNLLKLLKLYTLFSFNL